MRLILSTILAAWTMTLLAIHPNVLPFEAEEVILIDTARIQELSFLQEMFLGDYDNISATRALRLQERLNAELATQITAIQMVSYTPRRNREKAFFFSGKFSSSTLSRWAAANGLEPRTTGNHPTFERPHSSKDLPGTGANAHPYVGLSIAILSDQVLVVGSSHDVEKVLQRLDRNEPSQPIPAEAIECFSTTENGGIFKYAQPPIAKPDDGDTRCQFYYVAAGIGAGDLNVHAGGRFVTKEKSGALIEKAKSFQKDLADTIARRGGANTDPGKAARGYAVECIKSVQFDWEKETLLIRLKYPAEKTKKALNYLKES